MKIKYKLLIVSILYVIIYTGCRPEMPVTSSIIIDTDAFSLPVNNDLYGLTIEEINHAVDGGIYAELIQNRSFEDGVPPLNCPYDASRNVLITPNGWAIPFMRGDSIPGWHKLSAGTSLWPDNKELINDKNRRSLLVSVSASAETGKGGIAAEGYKGIPIRNGEKYQLSFYVKGASMVPKTISIALVDSTGENYLSDVYRVSPVYDWRKFQHTFTASASTDKAMLTFTADSSTVFWLDVVSLFPEKTWNNRKNGLRPDLMELIAGLHPRFIRFPGGSFVEGYTAGTFPIWKETVGEISERKHFWNIWSYGTTNGVGYYEYLQMCEDLKAEPVYVVNSGVTSQSRRPRYEDITAMDKLVQDALDAIAYANHPADSVFGAMRAKHGHPEPFGLKYIEIGSENYGQEYTKRFQLFKKAINERFPEVTVIASSTQLAKMRNDWTDSHIYAGEVFFMANHDRYDPSRYSRRAPSVFIGEFSLTDKLKQGTLRAAIGEACFLIGVENNPDVVKRLAYAPIVGNVNFQNERQPAVLFDNSRAVPTPSYHMLKMFNDHRGDEVLKTKVDTYSRPQVTFGRAGIEMFDNSYEIRNVKMDGRPVTDAAVLSGGWKIDNGTLIPDANRWNYLLTGDSLAHDYTFSAEIKRTKGSGQIQFRVRDNGRSGNENDYIGMAIGSGSCEFYHQAGGVKDTLRTPVNFPFESNRWYTIQISCKDESLRCYIDDVLVHDANVQPLPSLVSVATFDKASNTILLKVVNTTMHEEKTALDVQGMSVASTADVIELSGQPDARNTFTHVSAVIPVEKQISFSLGGPMIYNFPPNSITIMKLKID